MDIQTLLIVALLILAVSLGTASVYVILVLREVRNTIQKVNNVIDDVHKIKGAFVNPTATIFSTLNTVMETIKAIKAVRTIADIEEDED